MEYAIEFKTWLVAFCTTSATILASCHAILKKRDNHAAIAWTAIIVLVPLAGAILYLFFGINRIKRKALALKEQRLDWSQEVTPQKPYDWPALSQNLPSDKSYMAALARLIDSVTRRPLLPGNKITPLTNGEQAFGSMLEAIENAQRSVTLATYLFDNDRAGRLFAEVLSNAVARGIHVRVLIDDVGARYCWPSIEALLQRRKVPVARFLPTLLPWRTIYLNLRNHRKILVVDGSIGFTGGMNIRSSYLKNGIKNAAIQDLHFKIQGPVVAHLQEAFAQDWHFTTGEKLAGQTWFPEIKPQGAVTARGIADGPDEDLERLRWSLHGALECAQSSIKIVTPYFLPDQSLITALNVAAMTGIAIDIVLPQKNNLKLVQWASAATLWQLLERGCRVWLSAPPFDHTKLMLVDGIWTLFGSTNWDARSLRLNFEFNVECYDKTLAKKLEKLIDDKIKNSAPAKLSDMEQRPLPIKLRDGAARLFSPYL